MIRSFSLGSDGATVFACFFADELPAALAVDFRARFDDPVLLGVISRLAEALVGVLDIDLDLDDLLRLLTLLLFRADLGGEAFSGLAEAADAAAAGGCCSEYA